MADTAENRRTACAAFSWYLAPGVTPLATPDAEWRAEVGWGYFIGGGGGFTPDERDHNTTLREYLNDQYGLTNLDVTPLVDRYIDADTIADKTVSMRELKVATDIENR